MKYSIIYIETHPEIQERLSVGLMVADGDLVEVRTSIEKIKAAEVLLSKKEFVFVSRTLAEMKKNVQTEQEVSYLSRYSNNLITVSPLQSIDMDNTPKNREWLYHNYIYNQKRKGVSAAQ